MSANNGVIVNFLIYGQFGGIQKPNSKSYKNWKNN